MAGRSLRPDAAHLVEAFDRGECGAFGHGLRAEIDRIRGSVAGNPVRWGSAAGFGPAAGGTARLLPTGLGWKTCGRLGPQLPRLATAIARGGNVIGGDVSRDRLLPDLIAAFARGQAPLLRFPRAVRPWQHVLDCLNGYLTLVDALLSGSGLGEWNFGPGRDSFVEVGRVATLAAELWGGGAN
ncbi:MAG: hypothetical protein ACLP9Y_04815 [Mycobacterium sp.]